MKSAAALNDLEAMAARFQDDARKLLPGPERDALLQEIGRFRVQINILPQTKAKK